MARRTGRGDRRAGRGRAGLTVLSGTPNDVGPIDVEAAVAECRAAHARLFATVDTLDDSGRPSLLPRWSVGHVLTHLARNADSHVRILEAARQGRPVEQYAGGPKQRADDIESRELKATVDDLRESVGQRSGSLWALGLASLTVGFPCGYMPSIGGYMVLAHAVITAMVAWRNPDWKQKIMGCLWPTGLAIISAVVMFVAICGRWFLSPVFFGEYCRFLEVFRVDQYSSHHRFIDPSAVFERDRFLYHCFCLYFYHREG